MLHVIFFWSVSHVLKVVAHVLKGIDNLVCQIAKLLLLQDVMHLGTCHCLAYMIMIASLYIPPLFWSSIFNWIHVHVVYVYLSPSNQCYSTES